MKKNNGLEYEVLVQSIFQEIHNQDSAKNIIVQHDVTLRGKSGTKYQIDVFWKFELGGFVYSAVVQAKDWKDSVKQAQVLELKGILDDLPKRPRGIIVTKKGFQKGAKKIAKSYGIDLFELTEVPKPAPMEVKVGSFAQFKVNLEERCFEIISYPYTYGDVTFNVKNSWIKTKPKDLDLKTIFESFKNSNVWDERFYDSDFQPVETVGKVMIDVSRITNKEAESILEKEKVYRKSLSHKFKAPTYFSTKLEFLPFIEIGSIDFSVEVIKDELIKRPFIIQGITTFVLKNILSGKEKKFEVKDR